jgi:glycolate oxidase
VSSAPKVSLDELRSHFRSDQVSVDVVTLAQNAHDDAEWAPYVAPFAVVFAESTEDVASVVLFAGANGLSVVARGAGTGLSGGANSTVATTG